jgi:hypothetical protein
MKHDGLLDEANGLVARCVVDEHHPHLAKDGAFSRK